MGSKMKSKKVRKRKREKRLAGAPGWVKEFEGEHLVREYGKAFKLHITMAMIELDELGLLNKKNKGEAKEDRRLEKKKTREQNLRKKERRLLKKERERLKYEDDYGDETFAYIAGETSNGFPYGVTHDEMEEFKFDTLDASWLEFDDTLNVDPFAEDYHDICVDLEFWYPEEHEELIEEVRFREHSEAPPENSLTGANWQSFLEEIEQVK